MNDDLLIVVTARGGSKRLPGKNLKVMGGRSLVAHAAAAIATAGLDGVAVLSTDDQAIADEGRRAGLIVPYLRPKELATDTASTVDVVLNVLDWYKETKGRDPLLVMVLQPTSPLRGGGCLRAGLALMAQRPDAGSVVAMTALHVAPASVYQIDPSGYCQPVSDSLRRPVLVPNGVLYITRVKNLRRECSVYAEPVLPLMIDPRRAVDIDTQADWDLAEAILASGLPPEPSSLSDYFPPPTV